MARLILSLLLCSLALPTLVRAQQPATSLGQQPAPPVPPPDHSRVYYATDPALLTGSAPNAPVVEALVNQLLLAVTAQKTVPAAWRTLVSPSDHIGIKISASGGSDLSTHPAIVSAVLHGLTQAGIPMSQVVIWDRTAPETAGYHPTSGGPGIRHIEPFTGYDPRAVVTVPSIGKLIWGDAAYQSRGPSPLQPSAPEQYSAQSHWSRLICGLNKIINIPVMAASEDCGIAGCIYNVTVPNVDNWRRFVNEPDFGDPYLCELYADSHAGPKVILNIMDGLTAQFGGGPDWQPGYSWTHATLYAGRDPVAIDATALRLVEAWRKDAKLPSVAEHARYLRTAATMGLGAYQADQIDLIDLNQAPR